MSLKDIKYEYTYDSDDNDILNDFYIPVLREAKTYDRIAGFFSSTCFGVASRGIKGLIDNHGKMRMIISPRVSKDDAEMIKKASSDPEGFLSETLIKSIDDLDDALEKDYVSAMGWMIANGYLEIKIAVVLKDSGEIMPCEEIEEAGLFHIKTGIIYDNDNNIISFSGSINESASGWVRNAEHFDVHRNWIDGHVGFCNQEIERFDSYWSGRKGNTKVYNIPSAVEKKLLDNAPSSIDDIEFFKSYKTKKRLNKNDDIEPDISLYSYQKEAFNKWIKNNNRMLCEMATGTGKTRTAIACILHALKTCEKLMVIISCPQNTLSMQWYNDECLKGYKGRKIIADSTNTRWRIDLEDALYDIQFNTIQNCIVFACSKTFSNSDFIEIVKKFENKVNFMLVGDEAHGLGAVKTSKGLLELYKYRLGLSATPSRWFDDVGTNLLHNYFGNSIFEFSIYKALHTNREGTTKPFLTQYKYEPVFVNLTDEEISEYEETTKRIIKTGRFKEVDDKSRERYERLLMYRANIYKNAYEKYSKLVDILNEIGDDISDTIIFATDEQIDEVIDILSNRGISCARYTQKLGTRKLRKYGGKSEREQVIQYFKDKTYEVLVAIKCLDEGIDIPSAKRAIIMASSTNPREFIQRVGRVIRTAPNKDQAEIYDMIVAPSEKLNKELLKFELDVFEKEQNRIFEISENAINSVSVLKKIDDCLRRVHKWN